MSEQQSKKRKPLKDTKAYRAVTLRNKFFYMMYKYSSLVFVTSLMVFVASLVFFFVFLNRPAPPQYIAVNEDGTYIDLAPISDCRSKSEIELRQFALKALRKIYKYDYINYQDQLAEAGEYFTTEGWAEYFDAYSKSMILTGVKENKWIVTMKPEGVPEFTRQPTVEDGACTWEIRVPMSYSYIGNNSQNYRGDVTMRLSRVSVLRNSSGLGIKRIVFIPN